MSNNSEPSDNLPDIAILNFGLKFVKEEVSELKKNQKNFVEKEDLRLYVRKGDLENLKLEVKLKIEPLQKIVYGVIALILISVATLALTALGIK